jgi:hypothetical protein
MWQVSLHVVDSRLWHVSFSSSQCGLQIPSWFCVDLVLQMDELERQGKQLAELAKKLEALEKRYDRLIGKVDHYVPRTTAIMREGLPLEIFSRMALLKSDFQVFGLYRYVYFSESQMPVERSVDIYAVRDSVFTVPQGQGRMSGQSWPERNHLLIEVKQRRPGVDWVFAQKPASISMGSFAGSDVPVANSGFELRSSEAGASSSATPKDVNNAIAQLNQALLPFYVDVMSNHSFEAPGTSWRYASVNGTDHVYLILITNATLRYFSPPSTFGEIEYTPAQEQSLFREVPWIVYQPEHSAGLQYHQRQVVAAAHASEEIKSRPATEFGDVRLLEYLAKHAHEVHIINFNHLDKVVELVKNPPRLGRIEVTLSAEGAPGPPMKFTIGGEGQAPAGA